MDIVLAREIPETMRFDRHAVYTFVRGPNAGRAVKYDRPGVHPFEDCVHVVTADGKPFDAGNGKRLGINYAVCKPSDLVVK